MRETLEQVQQYAYGKGQQMKHQHRQQHSVLTTEAAVNTLSADFAQVSLVTFLRQPSITCASLCSGLPAWLPRRRSSTYQAS